MDAETLVNNIKSQVHSQKSLREMIYPVLFFYGKTDAILDLIKTDVWL